MALKVGKLCAQFPLQALVELLVSFRPSWAKTMGADRVLATLQALPDG